MRTPAWPITTNRDLRRIGAGGEQRSRSSLLTASMVRPHRCGPNAGIEAGKFATAYRAQPRDSPRDDTAFRSQENLRHLAAPADISSWNAVEVDRMMNCVVGADQR